MAETIKIGSGFKVENVTRYPAYAQVNGRFVRDVVTPGVESAFNFGVSVEEGKALEPGTTYDFTLVPQPKPQPDTSSSTSAPPSKP